MRAHTHIRTHFLSTCSELWAAPFRDSSTCRADITREMMRNPLETEQRPY